MEGTRLAPMVGIVACLVVVAGLAVPYVLIEEASAVGVYYGAGVINPLFAGLFVLVGVIVFAAGREERTDPALAAGAALVLGVFTVLLTAAWAFSVPRDLVLSLTTNQLLEYHRFAVVIVALPVPAAAGWYARALGVL